MKLETEGKIKLFSKKIMQNETVYAESRAKGKIIKRNSFLFWFEK